MKTIPFFDSYWYCYSNSTAMLLGSIGENISPNLIEPLTGVGIGAMFHKESDLPFFSGPKGLPDLGISKALKMLGFEFEEKFKQGKLAFPIEELKRDLKESPVIIGPLDMSFLVYNPKRPKVLGVDHYVLVYEIKDEKIYLNDPAGYAKVGLSFENLKNAWKAEKIGYRRGFYSSWTKPKRVNKPTDGEIYQQALKWFKTKYGGSEDHSEEVISHLASLARQKKLTPHQIDHLAGFALPLGVKRALDYATFFGNRNSRVKKLKLEQAKVFGLAQTSLMDEEWNDLSQDLEKLAEIEKNLKQIFLTF
jgi:hypothetical protein